jgi:far upstream element-binding protein
MGTELCTEEIMIPGPKVGMVIGKGGETIKRLQDAVCCKIIIVQDSHAVGASPKPLRIMGPPDAVAVRQCTCFFFLFLFFQLP